MALVIFGLLVSIPIIVWGSQLVIKLMDRFPVIITAGRHAAGLDRRHHGGRRPAARVRVLGRGSAGVVHLALDTRTQQPLALKLLSLAEGLPEPQAAPLRERFMAEAATARRLSHPDIVRVHGAGEQHGRAWLAMELLGGCDLGRYTHMSRLLPEPLVLRLAQRLARALAHAHAQGVTHRDIKPGNVMLDLPAQQVQAHRFRHRRAWPTPAARAPGSCSARRCTWRPTMTIEFFAAWTRARAQQQRRRGAPTTSVGPGRAGRRHGRLQRR
jgi:hypothetical protein